MLQDGQEFEQLGFDQQAYEQLETDFENVSI